MCWFYYWCLNLVVFISFYNHFVRCGKTFQVISRHFEQIFHIQSLSLSLSLYPALSLFPPLTLLFLFFLMAAVNFF